MAIESHSTPERAVTAGLEALSTAEAAARVEAPTPGDFASRCAAWHAEHDRMDQAYEEAHRLSLAMPDRPPVPDILKQSIFSQDGIERLPPESPVHGIARMWTASELHRIIEKAGILLAITTATGDRVSMVTERKPLSDDSMAKVSEMWSTALEYEEVTKARLEACAAIENEPTRLYGHVWPQGLALIAEPVETFPDFAEKVRIIRRLDLLTGGTSEDSTAALVAMFDNLGNLGGLPS